MAAVIPHRYATVAVGAGTPHPDNPRRGDLELIAESIETNGFFGALVVHEPTGHILVGNHRWQAAKDAGITQLPALMLDCDEDTAKRVLLADNRTAELARWDDQTLIELLNELAVSPRGLAGSGFDTADLARLLNRWGSANDPDAVPDPPPAARSRRGDLWLLGGHRLLCGDSTNGEDVARLMDGQTARLMATDPPYLVDYTGGNHPQSKVNRAVVKDRSWDDYRDPAQAAEFYVAFLESALPHLAADAPIYQWHADGRRRLVDEAWESAGFFVHQVLLWVKSRPVLTRSDFMWQSEPCAYGWRRGHRPGTRRRPPANTSNVWQLDQKSANNEHPTEKPVQLFTDPYTWHLRAGEVGYEPFSGSGTAIAAAEVTGRRCFALELEPVYVDVACLRWQRLTGVKPTREDGTPVDFEEVSGAA